MSNSSPQVRLLTVHDLPLVERLLQSSEYVYQRFTLDELPALLRHFPAAGIFKGSSLHGFLLSQVVNPPCAWIGGFGVSWTESHRYIEVLDTLLKHLQQDWLRIVLLSRRFLHYRLLYSYDKVDYTIPTSGNSRVQLRPVERHDIPTLLAIEEACFEDLWRYDAVSFADIAATHPYFVVAELNGKVVGYQFNALEGEHGYLVRIAVHPSVNSRGIGTRLMVEAIRFFQKERVLRIMLNTQDDNIHAHRLYEWFGFMRVQQMGFVLRKYL